MSLRLPSRLVRGASKSPERPAGIGDRQGADKVLPVRTFLQTYLRYPNDWTISAIVERHCFRGFSEDKKLQNMTYGGEYPWELAGFRVGELLKAGALWLGHWSARANPNSGHPVALECLCDGPHPIVPGRRSTGPYAEVTERERSVPIDHDYILRSYPVS